MNNNILTSSASNTLPQQQQQQTQQQQQQHQQQQPSHPTSKKSPPTTRRLIFIMLYALHLILIWSFTLSRSMAFATNKLGTSFPPPMVGGTTASSTRPAAGTEMLVGAPMTYTTRTTALNMFPRFLQAHRLVSESLAAGTMASLGDFLAQRKERGTKYDPIRTSHFCFKGLGEGIMWSFWYRMVEQWSKLIAKTLLSYFPSLQVLESALKISVCIVMDLLLACPLIYGLWDIPVPALLRGERNIMQQIRSKLVEMVFASCKVWLPVNIVIYNMPVEYRVYLCSAADVFWQSIVSSISSRPLMMVDEQSLPKAFD